MQEDTHRSICVGVILSAHGVRGAVKIRSFTEDPLALYRYPLTDLSGKRFFKLKPCGTQNNLLIASIEHITTREDAQKLHNTELYTSRHNLPSPAQEEFYIEDLRGLTVHATDNSMIGTITDIHNFGAGTILEIQHINQKTELYPFTQNCFPEIHVDKGYVVCVPPETVS